MEPLRVEPDDLEKFSSTMRDLADQAEPARNYAEKWLGLSMASGRIFLAVTDAVARTQDSLTANYSSLNKLAGSAAAELHNSAQMYRSTDRTNAENLDRTYPGAI